jgi:hypothetical protein
MLVMMFGCDDDNRTADVIPEPETEEDKDTLTVDSTIQQCDSVFIATYSGTACCITGSMVAKPGDIFRYHYQMNHRDAQVTWFILEGDISIIDGQNTHTVTVQFGKDFTSGVINGQGYGIKRDDAPRLRCSDRVVVSNH